jgi:hypothetical protein
MLASIQGNDMMQLGVFDPGSFAVLPILEVEGFSSWVAAEP